MTDAHLSNDEIAAAGLADWRPIAGALLTRWRTKDFATGLRLANAIGAAAEAANHHPDLDLRYDHLGVRLRSHDVFGITTRDVELARTISALAAEQGVTADPTAVSVVELALDTPDEAALKPFWRTVLGYRDHPHATDEIRDGDGDGPAIWFQTSGSDEPRQRWHLDVRVPAEVAEQRIADAVAAGGTVVDRAPTFVVLADAEGNKACICTCP
ncbi:MAG: 4a-hydroxytetrahydrobiopterin dehydratase [Ilumatobacteraceae bacterium]